MNPPSPLLSTANRTGGPAAHGAPHHDLTHASLALFSNDRFQVPISSRLPKVRAWTQDGQHRTTAVLGLVFTIVLAAGIPWTSKLLGKVPFSGPTWTVVSQRLQVSIVERGTLESAKNSDIVCTVRSGTKGSTIATTIKWIIDPGVQVVKGEKLVELDSSGFVEQLKDQKIKVDQAKASWVAANEERHIQESQNESDIEAAKNTLDLAKIDLEKYKKAEFIQALEDVDGRINVVRADLQVAKARFNWANRMYGLGYMSKAQAKGDESRTDALLIGLKKLETERRVLVDFTERRTVQDLAQSYRKPGAHSIVSKASPARNWSWSMRTGWPRTPSTSSSQPGSKRSKPRLPNASSSHRRMAWLFITYQTRRRSGGGSQQSIVAQGEPVREGQKLMQIPDLSQMVVNVRVHEAMVSNLRNTADINDESSWQMAQIRIDAVPNRILRGHVRTVDTVASQQDWFAADVKLYKTVVSIDEPVAGLKPGMSAEVTIYADESPNDVMVVPLQAIAGTISLGARPHCFVVRQDGRPERRDVVVGMSNQRLVEVKSGLEVGDKIVLNPASLVALQGEMKVGTANGKNDDDAPNSVAEGNDGTGRK